MGLKPRSAVAATAVQVELARARAFWCAKQGICPRLAGGAANIITRAGWLRTLGGVDVYLAARARSHELTRASMDADVARLALRVAPAARGCIYLIPDAHMPLALAHARALSRTRTERELAQVGVSWDEIHDLGNAVLAVLAKRPATTAEIRAALPDGAARSLGERGKRVGMSSPLPVALRELEFSGRVERTLADGRLDTERYHWRVLSGARPASASDLDLSDPGVRVRELARLLLRVAGPITAKQLATWAGFSQRDALAGIASAEAVPVLIDGATDARAFVLPDELEDLRAAEASPGFSFLPVEDNLLTVHDGPAVHVDPAFHDRPVDSWGSSRPTTLGQARHIGQRALFRGDRMIGLWEYDPDAGEVVCATFELLSRAESKALAREGAALAHFISQELGHARSFSLDTDAAVRDRAARLRALA